MNISNDCDQSLTRSDTYTCTCMHTHHHHQSKHIMSLLNFLKMIIICLDLAVFSTDNHFWWIHGLSRAVANARAKLLKGFIKTDKCPTTCPEWVKAFGFLRKHLKNKQNTLLGKESAAINKTSANPNLKEQLKLTLLDQIVVEEKLSSVGRLGHTFSTEMICFKYVHYSLVFQKNILLNTIFSIYSDSYLRMLLSTSLEQYVYIAERLWKNNRDTRER